VSPLDTSPEVAALYRRLLASRSDAERLAMVADMFDAARELIESAIRHEHPDLPPTELRIELFRRLHGHALDADTVAAVEARLRQERR